MAKFTTGSTLGLNKDQFMACEMLARGWSEDRIKETIWHVNKDSPLGERQKAARKLHAWMEDPKFVEGYRAIVRQIAFPACGAAIQRLLKQVGIEDEKWGFLSNKAANDILTRLWAAVMGDDDKQIVVKVEGMPDLGTPDADD